MTDLFDSLSSYDETITKSPTTYSGLLGVNLNGARTVNHETRNGFVYVRFRDNLSEVVQAFNEKVSPAYDLPVLIERRGNIWYVVGRDLSRYQNWGTPAPFLPKHGGQHSFNRDANTGADIVPIYPDQFMPLLVYPSGTVGAGNLLVAPYVLQRDADFIYVGNTGTPNLLVYKPTNNQAIMGLVVLNTDTGNPQVLIASGTPLSGITTGTHQVLPYVPYPAANQEPLYAFRLVSGTARLTWDNLYNVRQFVGGGQGGSSVPSMITGSIPYAGSDGALKENNPEFRYDETLKQLKLGAENSLFNSAGTQFRIGIVGDTNTQVTVAGLVAGTGTSGSPSMSMNGYRSRGTPSVPTPVVSGDALMTWIGAGYDGANWINSTRLRFYADGNWVTGAYTQSRMDFEVTPSGSATRRTQFQVYGDSVNIPTGSTYNVGGTPHTHEYIPTNGWQDVPFTVNYFSADSPSFVINVQGNVTGSYAPGLRWKLGHLGTTKYFIQTGLPSYVSGAYTSINLYGGSDYTLTTGTLSNPQISREKAPLGFPTDSAKWDYAALTDTTDRNQATPGASIFYNPGSLSFFAPIGSWRLRGTVTPSAYRNTAGTARIRAGISTSTSSFSDNELVVLSGLYGTASGEYQIFDTKHWFKQLTLTTKTQYYIIMQTPDSGMTQISLFNGATGYPLRIVLECAYL